MEAEKPVADEAAEGSEELFLSKHSEWDALQWLEKFLPGGSQNACAKAEMQRKGFTSTSLHYAVRAHDPPLRTPFRAVRTVLKCTIWLVVVQEINLNFFSLFLQRAHERFFPHFGRGTFVDIGSGLGKSVIAAGLVLPWSRCAGIEVMEDMHGQSLVLLERWREAAPSLVSAPMQQRPSPTEMVTACADATALKGPPAEWVESAEVIFMNSLVFEPPLMEAIAAELGADCFVMLTMILPWRSASVPVSISCCLFKMLCNHLGCRPVWGQRSD